KRKYQCLTGVFSMATASTRPSGLPMASCSRPAIIWSASSARPSGSACGRRRGRPSRRRSPRRSPPPFPESRVRVILTRGVGKLDLDPASTDDTQLIVIVFPLGAPTPEMYDNGVAVAIVSSTRNSPQALDPEVKSGNYLNNVLALGEARRRSKAYEAILCGGDGSVAEGSTSNIFTVIGGEVRTPPPAVGILDGITRAKAIALCRENGIPFAERRITPDELRGADEAFITSATRGVLPVTTVDEKPVGGGVPGPVTRRLMALYDAL